MSDPQGQQLPWKGPYLYVHCTQPPGSTTRVKINSFDLRQPESVRASNQIAVQPHPTLRYHNIFRRHTPVDEKASIRVSKKSGVSIDNQKGPLAVYDSGNLPVRSISADNTVQTISRRNCYL